jgi:hypothetical protein
MIASGESVEPATLLAMRGSDNSFLCQHSDSGSDCFASPSDLVLAPMFQPFTADLVTDSELLKDPLSDLCALGAFFLVRLAAVLRAAS